MQEARYAAAVILAGGTSRRMGEERNKLLLPLCHRLVLVHVIEAALGSRAQPVVLVLGHQASEVRAHLQSCIKMSLLTIIENADYSLGMSTSMQAGLRALSTLHDYKNGLDSVVFLLGDQPIVSAILIDRLLALREQTGKRIILPLYQGRRGNPVVFSLELSDELMQVRGDEGGRGVLKRHPEEIATLETGELAASFDVDTWDAYLQVQAIYAEKTLE